MEEITLRHAAEISPFVTSRTIGHDIEPLPDNGIMSQSKSDKASDIEKKSDVRVPQTSSYDMMNSSMLTLDCQTIRTSVLLREAEQQRRRSIRQQVLQMQKDSVVNRQRRSLDSLKSQMHNNDERTKWLQERLTEAQIQEKAERETSMQIAESQRALDTIRTQTKRKLQNIVFEGICQHQKQFRRKYELISTLLISIDRDALLACGDYNSRLKELISLFEQLIAKIKSSDCGAAELNTAENLCTSLDALESQIVEDLNTFMRREQQLVEAQQKVKQQEEHERQEKEQQQQLHIEAEMQKQQHDADAAAAAEAAAAAATTATNGATTIITPLAQDAVAHNVQADAISAVQYVSEERLQFYKMINAFYLEKVERVKPLQGDDAFKKYRFACQKAINTPVNAISAVSPQHLQLQFEKLYHFISGQPIKAADGQNTSINDHPLGRDYCILLMAKRFVNQGDTAISSNPQAAFPVASIVVSLWKVVPDFGRLFLAYIFKESPYLVPFLQPQRQEKQQEMFLKRQAGIARLFAATMITAGRRADGPSHPFGVENGWRWFTNFLNLEPLPDISATLVLEMLQVMGSDMCAAYGRQFVKLLVYIQHQYLHKLNADEGGPKTRLQMLLRKFLVEGQIAKPVGMVPAGFW